MPGLYQNVKNDFSKVLSFFQDKTFHPYQIKKKVEGITFDFIVADLEAKDWYDHPSTSNDDNENLEMRFLRDKIVHPGDRVFECGTHHGMTAILLSSWVGEEGKVVTFELFPKNAEIAQENISLNKLKNVILEQKGLGEANGKVKFFRKSNACVKPDSSVSLGFVRNLIYGLEEVDITSLDNYARQVGFNPTLLKIDVEGFEAKVLKGARDILSTAPKLAIEIHTEILPRYNTSVQEIFNLVDIHRYQCWIQWDDSKTPVEYDFQKEINHRVHLFAIPNK